MSGIRKIIKQNGEKIKVLSQDEIIPKKLEEYFARHPEITKKLSRNRNVKIILTDKTQNATRLIKKWFGKHSFEIISNS